MSWLIRKKFKIEFEPPVVEVDAEWSEKTLKTLEDVIHGFYNQNDATSLTYNQLYIDATTMVERGFGEQLYSGLVTTMTSDLKDLAALIEDSLGDDFFLEELHGKWKVHKSALKKIGEIFTYMDRTYILQTRKSSVHELGLQLWQDHVIHTTNTQGRLKDTLLKLVQGERDGEIINKSLMRDVVKMLMDLGSSVYQQDFEDPFLVASTNFYHAESQRLIQTCDCGDYLKNAEKRLNDEIQRVRQYLDAKSEVKITNVVEKEMIESQMTTLVQTGLVNMVVEDKYEDLGRMYNLFRRVPNGLSLTMEVMTSHMWETMKQLVTDPERLKDPVDFVQHLLDEKDKHDKIIDLAFNNDKMFQNALKSVFENFINLNTQSPELMALFVDEELRRGLKGVSDEGVLDKVKIGTCSRDSCQHQLQ